MPRGCSGSQCGCSNLLTKSQNKNHRGSEHAAHQSERAYKTILKQFDAHHTTKRKTVNKWKRFKALADHPKVKPCITQRNCSKLSLTEFILYRTQLEC